MFINIKLKPHKSCTQIPTATTYFFFLAPLQDSSEHLSLPGSGAAPCSLRAPPCRAACHQPLGRAAEAKPPISSPWLLPVSHTRTWFIAPSWLFSANQRCTWLLRAANQLFKWLEMERRSLIFKALVLLLMVWWDNLPRGKMHTI